MVNADDSDGFFYVFEFTMSSIPDEEGASQMYNFIRMAVSERDSVSLVDALSTIHSPTGTSHGHRGKYYLWKWVLLV